MSTQMVPVLSSEQARAVLRGRAPLVPIEYEQAIKALTECISLDEAKYWSDKADALAAWAKIYRDDSIGRKAKVLKLHAYRRMGELATELSKPVAASWYQSKRGKFKGGKPPGPVAMLKKRGLNAYQADAAVAVAKLPKRIFNEVMKSDYPPAPTILRATYFGRGSESYRTLMNAATGNGLMTFRTFCRSHSATQLGKTVDSTEVAKVKELITEVTEWLDELDQALPK